MDSKKELLKKRLAGFKYAFRGVKLLKHEHNARLHGIIGACVIVAGFLLNISRSEWIAVVIACGCVPAAEALNTAIERLADIVEPEYSEAVRNIKDIAAGGVLLMALAAAVVGLIVFVPRLAELF
ncbi:MAG: diacylglycerol kinase family protein [Tannerellaceae bacterium]|jgi:diacylglycerol kinase (ATP)|nr:diacylglycerol kinase family protein [Tannerellaceae bacterium]